MEQPNFFLRTKLLLPRGVADLLNRPRLIDRLKANLSAPVTMVAADAGCGKTTLVAEFVRGEKRPTVWYQLDHTDADPIVFLTYLAQGIKSIDPEFGNVLLPYLGQANEELLRTPERAANLLINEMIDRLERPFILVLDDYHHIGTDTIVHKIVDRILQYSSELLHVIITTRDLPPLAIMRLRTQSSAAIITRDDLLFTDEEVKNLFKSTLKVDLDESQVAEYRERTHGWVTALQLVKQVADREEGSARGDLNLSEMLHRSERDIFDYFAEEVFAREDATTQAFLTHLSLLESLPLETCSLLFPEMRCAAVLPGLTAKNIFLTVAGETGFGEEYRFHPLFRDFLRRRLRSDIGIGEIASERNRLAEVFLTHGRWEQALPFLLDAENFERAAEIVAGHGNAWIGVGAIASLESFIARIPDDALDKYPRTLLHAAEIERLHGNIARSSGLLNRAVKLLKAGSDPTGQAEALHALASIERRRGRPKEALKLIERAEKLVLPDSETFLKCQNTRGLCLVLEGDWAAAESQFRTALELAEGQSNRNYVRMIAHNLALPAGFRGDFAEALRWFKKIFSDDRPDEQLPQEAIGHLNVARLHLFRGEFEQTELHLARAIELCQLFNLNSLLPEVLETYANFYRDKSDFLHAAEFYERALAAYDDARIDLDTREINEERAKYFLLTGDTVRARSLLEWAIPAREMLKNELAFNTARLTLCRVDLIEGNTAGLADRVAELRDLFHGNSNFYDEAQAEMLLAETYFASNRQKDMVKPVTRVLDLAARLDYDHWLKTEIARNRPIFEYEDIFERLPPDLSEAVKAADVRVATGASVNVLTAGFVDLTVKVLGHVEIFRDPTRPFAPDAWTTRRSRDILCYIASSKNRRVSKDVLIDAFWGDEELEAIEKNFHPTISHIRKGLNSRQALKQNFIVFRDGAYALNPEFSYRIDTESFLAAVTAAEGAKRDHNDELLRVSLTRAYNLYRGEFMDGVYDSWTDDSRLFYREQFSRILNALAKLSVTEKRPADALKYANEALALDAYREDLHRLIMKVLAAQSKPAALKKHFDSMSTLLKQELGISPSAETRKLYSELSK
ncbi:MAG: BTAD domain-containing putative transcriptional regulator [Pyrinomonadaceae bacterium]